MKHVLIALTVLGLGIAAFAGDGSELFAVQKTATLDGNSVLGYWSGKDQQNNGITFSMRLKIEQAQLTAAVRCSLNGQVKYAELTTPIALTGSTVAILKAAQAGDNNCNISLPEIPATAYQVKAGVLTLDGMPDSMDKLKDLP